MGKRYPKEREFVAKHDDFDVLRTARADREAVEHGYEAAESVGHSWSDSSAFFLVSTLDLVFGPHRSRAC